MASTEARWDVRFRKLELRLDRIEAHLNLASPIANAEAERKTVTPGASEASASPASVAPIAAAASIASPPLEETRPTHLPPPIPVLPPQKATTSTKAAAFASMQAGNADPFHPSSTINYQRPQASTVRPAQSTGIEQLLGLKLAGWIGAAVLLIGLILGLKLAYDLGWFGGMPPALKLSAIVITGFGLIGAGEWVLRRVHRVPAACLFGAGVATLFIAAYVGNVYFHLYDSTATQIAMTVAMLIGAVIAIRGNLASIGILALIGGNLAPMLLGRHGMPSGAFLIYLLSLQVIALFLAAFGRGGKWWTLRGMSLATTSLWIASLLADNSADPKVLIAMLVSAAIYHGELILTSVFAERRRAKLNVPAWLVPAPVGQTFSLLVTAALTVGLLWHMEGATSAVRTTWIASLAVVQLVVGLAIAARPSRVLSPLGLTHRFAGVMLLALAVPLAVSGDSVAVGWLLFSLVLAIFFFVTRSPMSRICAPIIWLFSLANIAWNTLSPQRIGLSTFDQSIAFTRTFLGVDLRPHGGVALSAAISGYLIARLIAPATTEERSTTPGRRWNDIARGIAALATTAAAFASIGYLHATTGLMALLAVAWLLIAVSRLLRPISASRHALALLAIAFAKLAVNDITGAFNIYSQAFVNLSPILNGPFLIGLAIAGSLAALYRLRRDELIVDDPTPNIVNTWLRRFIAAVSIVSAWTFTFESFRIVDSLGYPSTVALHLKSVLISAVWMGCATAAIGVARRLIDRQDNAPPRPTIGALGLLALFLAFKYFTLDTIAWRILHAPLGDATSIFIEWLSAAAIAAGLLAVAAAQHFAAPRHLPSMLHSGLALVAVAVLLWAGSIEIDRFLLGAPPRMVVANPHLATLVALSGFWGAFAIVAIVVGFGRRVAGLRYFGLALLGITLLKIVVIDTQTAGTGYRVVSFLAVGAVLILTSIVYGKVSPRFVGNPSASAVGGS